MMPFFHCLVTFSSHLLCRKVSSSAFALVVRSTFYTSVVILTLPGILFPLDCLVPPFVSSWAVSRYFIYMRKQAFCMIASLSGSELFIVLSEVFAHTLSRSSSSIRALLFLVFAAVFLVVYPALSVLVILQTVLAIPLPAAYCASVAELCVMSLLSFVIFLLTALFVSF